MAGFDEHTSDERNPVGWGPSGAPLPLLLETASALSSPALREGQYAYDVERDASNEYDPGGAWAPPEIDLSDEEIEQALDGVSSGRLSGMGPVAAIYSAFLFLGNVILSPIDRLTNESIKASSAGFALGDSKTSILGFKYVLQLKAQARDAQKSLLSQKRKVAELVTSILFSATYFGAGAVNVKFKAATNIFGMSTKAMAHATFVSAIGPVVLAVMSYTAAFINFRAAWRAHQKTNPHYLLNDRVKKIRALDALGGNEQGERSDQRARLMNQMAALDHHLGDPSDIPYPNNNTVYQNHKLARGRSTAKDVLSNFQKPPGVVSENLATFLIDKHKIKRTKHFKAAASATTTGVAATFLAVTVAGGPAGWGIAAAAIFAATAIYGVKLIHGAIKRASNKKEAIKEALTHFARSTEQGGDPAVRHCLMQLSKDKVLLEKLRGRYKSRLSRFMFLDKGRRNRINALIEKIGATEKNLDTLVTDAIVRQKLGLSTKAKVSHYVTANDKNMMVSEFVDQYVQAKKADAGAVKKGGVVFSDVSVSDLDEPLMSHQRPAPNAAHQLLNTLQGKTDPDALLPDSARESAVSTPVSEAIPNAVVEPPPVNVQVFGAHIYGNQNHGQADADNVSGLTPR